MVMARNTFLELVALMPLNSVDQIGSTEMILSSNGDKTTITFGYELSSLFLAFIHILLISNRNNINLKKIMINKQYIIDYLI